MFVELSRVGVGKGPAGERLLCKERSEPELFLRCIGSDSERVNMDVKGSWCVFGLDVVCNKAGGGLVAARLSVAGRNASDDDLL